MSKNCVTTMVPHKINIFFILNKLKKRRKKKNLRKEVSSM